MSSPESQRILAAYARYKKTDLNRNNREQLNAALKREQQRATDTLNNLQAAFAPSQRIVQNFPSNNAIEAARQRALAEVAANPPSSGGSSNRNNIQQQAQDFYNRNMPPAPAQIDPVPSVGTIIRTADLLLSRLPTIPTNRAEYDAIYKKLSDAQKEYADWKASTPKPRYYTWSGGWSSYKVRRARESRAKVDSWNRKNNSLRSKVRSAQVHWDQTSWGMKNIEIRIKALMPFLELDDLTRPEIAKAHNEITAASNTISRILNQKLFIERARLGELQKLMLTVLDKKKTAERLNAEAMQQDTLVTIRPTNNPNLQPPAETPLPPEPEPTAPSNVFSNIGDAIAKAFTGNQTELDEQAYMVARANLRAAKRLAEEA